MDNACAVNALRAVPEANKQSKFIVFVNLTSKLCEVESSSSGARE